MTLNQNYSTFLDLLKYRADSRSGTANNVAFLYLNEREEKNISITYCEMEQEAKKIAANIQKK